ncbi:MAG TPA: hypothetical protein PKY59_03470 [Pyrinomonadaceae bacterium]|nr:hypothetical protein [Pyrinomonadaceae bacterium]
MTDDERRELDMFNHASACLTAQFSDLSAPPHIAEAIQNFRGAITQIETQSTSQTAEEGTAEEGTAERSVARNAVKEFMTRFARTAQVIARRRVGFDENFPMPYGKNDEQLLASARAVADKAQSEREEFTLLGINVAYLQATAGKITAFSDALEKTNAATSSRGAAVSSRKNAFDIADENFEIIDIFIRNQYAEQPEKLSAWRMATHIQRAPKGKNDGSTPTT